MKRYLKLYWLLSIFSIKTAWQNKSGFLFFMVGKFIRFLMFFFFMITLVSRTKVLAGYSLNQTLVFFLTFNIIDTFTQMLFREVYRFRWLVTSGELDGILIRPYHPFLRILMGGLDVMDAFTLVPYLALLIYFLIQSHVLTALGFAVYLGLAFNSFLIATAFHIMVLALGILTSEVDHTMMIYRDISKMASVPVDIYQQPIRAIITFVIPVGVMMTFPVKGLFNLLNVNLIIISFALGILSILFSLWTWDKALKKYQSWGS